jgi:hypothetical protein
MRGERGLDDSTLRGPTSVVEESVGRGAFAVRLQVMGEEWS